MSPYEPLTLSHKPTTTTTPSPSLEDYTVSSNGFLPEHPPLERLLDPYYAPWETLAESLPTALAEQTLRASVDRLPILLTDRLPTESEWRRACLVLGFLAHAYIWGGDKPSEVCSPSFVASNTSLTPTLDPPPATNPPPPRRLLPPRPPPRRDLRQPQPLELSYHPRRQPHRP